MCLELHAIHSLRENRRLSRRGSDIFDRDQLLQPGRAIGQRTPRRADGERPYQLAYGYSYERSSTIIGWSLAILLIGVILIFVNS